MEEIFELIKAFNRLKEQIKELVLKIDLYLKSQSQPSAKYLNETEACKMLHVCPRTLAKMRADGSIPYIKSHRKIIYLASDLLEYLDHNMIK